MTEAEVTLHMPEADLPSIDRQIVDKVRELLALQPDQFWVFYLEDNEKEGFSYLCATTNLFGGLVGLTVSTHLDEKGMKQGEIIELFMHAVWRSLYRVDFEKDDNGKTRHLRRNYCRIDPIDPAKILSLLAQANPLEFPLELPSSSPVMTLTQFKSIEEAIINSSDRT